ncbi:MAG TPA: alpha/beta hydrolase [Pseudonocardiaceae bacterium]|nr:alpha/beta hydrolase [Pseudonocardiaceae bacterium]
MTTDSEIPRLPAWHEAGLPTYDGELPPLDHELASWPGRVSTAGPVPLHVREVPGPAEETGLFVHGLGGSSTNWTDLAALLSVRMNGLLVDLPGFGHTQPPRTYDFTLRSHAEAVIGYLEAIGRGPVHLFGNSMGGAISMMIAAERPELVRSLTLVAPAMPDLRPSLDRMADPRIVLAFLPVVGRPARRALAALSDRERTLQLIRLCFAQPHLIPPQRLAATEAEFTARRGMPWARRALDRSTVGLIRAWLARKPASLWTVAARVGVPTLVVWGADDKLVSVRKAARTASLLRNGRLLVLPDCGHVPQMECPEQVARATLGMLAAADTGQW